MDTSSPTSFPGSNTELDAMNLMGTVVSGIIYGVAFTICTLALSVGPSERYVPRLSWRIIMTCWFLSLATISTVLQVKWTLLAFVTQRHDLAPSTFIKENMRNWIYIMLNVLYVVINWSADGLLMFRFFCVFRNRALQWGILPVALYIGSLATGSLALHELATPGVTQDTARLANWLVIYRTVSLALCVMLTSLIAGRLIFLHRRAVYGLRNAKSRLLVVARMIVESALLETVSTLIYVITVGVGSPLQNVFLPTLGQIQVVAPMLIIYRVIRGRDATEELPHHHDMSKQTLSIRINTAVSCSSMGCELSPSSPTRSYYRGFDTPRTPHSPTYMTFPFNDHKIKITPPLPSADPSHPLGLPPIAVKRTMTVGNV